MGLCLRICVWKWWRSVSRQGREGEYRRIKQLEIQEKETKNQDQLICSDQNIVLFKKITFHCWTALMVTKILLGYLYLLK